MAIDKDSDNPDANGTNGSRAEDSSSLDRKNSTDKHRNNSVGFEISGIDIRKLDADEIVSIVNEGGSDETAPPPLADDTLLNDMVPPSSWQKPPAPQRPKAKPKSARSSSSSPTTKVPKFNQPTIEDLEQLLSDHMGRRFKIAANNTPYYVQQRFTHGAKYTGIMSMSQTAMLVLIAAKQEALRLGHHEIGLEDILVALLQQHGFAAGQLLLGLHLNKIGKPFSLGDPAGVARKGILRSSGDTKAGGERLTQMENRSLKYLHPLVSESDMYFTDDADKMLVKAMYIAAQAGQSHAHSKHLLEALLDFKNSPVSAALKELKLTDKEIRAALSLCPSEDKPIDFVLYLLSALVNSLIRIRIFQGPVRKYRSFAIKKTESGEKKSK